MIEYLIKARDGGFLLLDKERVSNVLRPNSFESQHTEEWGDHRIQVGDRVVAFSFEEPGIHVIFENAEQSCEKICSAIVAEIVQNIEKEESRDCYALRLT